MSAKDVEAALRLLEKMAAEQAAPSHYVARHVLLALGAALRAGAAEAEVAGWAERARRAGAAAGPDWRRAVGTELSLACGEFVQSVDPRFVTLPAYDLDYTRRARARLEDRLLAARELGFALEPKEADMLELADRVLADLESKRSGRNEE